MRPQSGAAMLRMYHSTAVTGYRDELAAARARAEAAETELAKLRAAKTAGPLAPVRPPEALARFLEPDETVLWHGQPLALKRVLRSRGILLSGVVWLGGIALLALVRGPGLVWPLAAVGIAFMVQVVAEVTKAWNTHYAITDRQAMVVTGVTGHEVRRFRGKQIGERILRVSASDGTGDVIFRTEVAGPAPRMKRFDVGFLGIADAARVDALLRDRLDDQ